VRLLRTSVDLSRLSQGADASGRGEAQAVKHARVGGTAGGCGATGVVKPSDGVRERAPVGTGTGASAGRGDPAPQRGNRQRWQGAGPASPPAGPRTRSTNRKETALPPYGYRQGYPRRRCDDVFPCPGCPQSKAGRHERR
jgi:hypothetical protein